MRALVFDLDTLACVCRHQAVCPARGLWFDGAGSYAALTVIWTLPSGWRPLIVRLRPLVRLEVALRPLFPWRANWDFCPP